MTRPLLLLLPLLAGCVAPAALGPAADEAPIDRSAALFSVLPGESVTYEASIDGTQLHLRLWRPDAPDEWKAPAILVMSPYFGPDSREHADPNDPRTWDPADRPAYWRYQWLIDHFVPRGYAVALADVRGTGESGGCLEQTGPLQTQDGYDTVEWLAAQAWSNGRVGMFGKSYDAETQQSTATLAPPHLVTIVPVSSVAGQYDYSYYDGVPYTLQTMLSNVGYAAGDGLQPGSNVDAHRKFPERVGCNADHFRQGVDDSGTWNEYWEEREIRRGVAGVQASVLYVHGLQDWNVKPSNVREWFELIPSPKLGLLGQWAHDYPEANSAHPEWSRQDWQELVWRWYDHFLLGKPDPALEAMLGTVQVQDTEGKWRVQAAFPPTDAVEVAYWLVEGALTTTPTPGGAKGLYGEATPNPLGVFNGVPVTGARDEGITYVSEPLAAPLRWSGWPTMDLDVSLDKDDAHFAVWLLDVAPDGSSTWVDRAYLSAQHRDGVADPSPVPIGQTLTYHLRFFPGDTVIAAGHSVGVKLMPSDDWVSPAGNGHVVTVVGGVLRLPTVAPTPDDFLDAPLGDPITGPVNA